MPSENLKSLPFTSSVGKTLCLERLSHKRSNDSTGVIAIANSRRWFWMRKLEAQFMWWAKFARELEQGLRILAREVQIFKLNLWLSSIQRTIGRTGKVKIILRMKQDDNDMAFIFEVKEGSAGSDFIADGQDKAVTSMSDDISNNICSALSNAGSMTLPELLQQFPDCSQKI
ncbi:hypothetical protein BJ742DRAFT_736748 [Cladochytrium replicatum]|nr:hypothetical protein BJ742DRAFT_736748 [Cladochytrium replicatum]